MADSRTPALRHVRGGRRQHRQRAGAGQRCCPTASAPSRSRCRSPCRTRVGAAICFRLLRRRLRRGRGPAHRATVVRAAVAGGIAAAIAYAHLRGCCARQWATGSAGSLLGVLAGALVGGAFYLLAAWRMTEELRAVAWPSSAAGSAADLVQPRFASAFTPGMITLNPRECCRCDSSRPVPRSVRSRYPDRRESGRWRRWSRAGSPAWS